MRKKSVKTYDEQTDRQRDTHRVKSSAGLRSSDYHYFILLLIIARFLDPSLVYLLAFLSLSFTFSLSVPIYRLIDSLFFLSLAGSEKMEKKGKRKREQPPESAQETDSLRDEEEVKQESRNVRSTKHHKKRKEKLVQKNSSTGGRDDDREEEVDGDDSSS